MDSFKIGHRNFNSRLIIGTGKYKDLQETADAVKASGADLVTVLLEGSILQMQKNLC